MGGKYRAAQRRQLQSAHRTQYLLACAYRATYWGVPQWYRGTRGTQGQGYQGYPCSAGTTSYLVVIFVIISGNLAPVQCLRSAEQVCVDAVRVMHSIAHAKCMQYMRRLSCVPAAYMCICIRKVYTEYSNGGGKPSPEA